MTTVLVIRLRWGKPRRKSLPLRGRSRKQQPRGSMWWARSRSASAPCLDSQLPAPPPSLSLACYCLQYDCHGPKSPWQKNTESRTGVGVAYMLRFRAMVGMVRMGASFRGLWVFSWPGKINPLIGCHLKCHIELLYLVQMSCCGCYVLCYQHEATVMMDSWPRPVLGTGVPAPARRDAVP